MLTPRAPVSILLILAGETSIRAAASSTVIPAPVRRARRRAPSSRRRTVGLAVATATSRDLLLVGTTTDCRPVRASMYRWQRQTVCAFGTCHIELTGGILGSQGRPAQENRPVSLPATPCQPTAAPPAAPSAEEAVM